MAEVVTHKKDYGVIIRRLFLIVLFMLPLVYVIVWGQNNPYFEEIKRGAFILLVILLSFGVGWALAAGILALVGFIKGQLWR